MVTVEAPPQGETSGGAVAGGLAVTAGLLVLGVSSYAFLSLASHSVSKGEFSAVAALWSLVYALAGVFTPLEQEATRAVAQRRVHGQAIAPVVARVATIGAAAAVLVVLVLFALQGPLTSRILGGQRTLVSALAATLVATGASFVLRGVLAGTRRYRAYGGVLAGEGLLRVVGAGVLALAVMPSAGRLGLVLAAAALVPQLVGLLALPRTGGTPHPGSWAEVTSNLGWLVCASVVTQAVANAGPVVLQLLGSQDEGEAGRFLAAFVLVRIPLLFVSALQASLLPRLVSAVESDDHGAYGLALKQMIGIVGALGTLALVGFAAIGPIFVSLLLGRSDSIGRVDLVVLGLSSVLFVLAALLQSAVLALGGHRVVAACWAVGGVLFVAGCLLPLASLLRLEIAYVVSSAAVPLLLAAWLTRARSARRRALAQPVG